jgi:flagellar basal body-associated protein FliL
MTHHHETSQTPAPKGPGIFLGIAVVVLLLAAVAAGLWINRTSSATEAEDAARSVERTKNLAELQAADTATLTTYGWNDRAKGVVRVPITRAMELVLPTLTKGQNAQP